MKIQFEVKAKSKIKGKISFLEEISAELKSMGFEPRPIEKLTDDYGHLMVEAGDFLKIEELFKNKGLYYNPIMHYYVK